MDQLFITALKMHLVSATMVTEPTTAHQLKLLNRGKAKEDRIFCIAVLSRRSHKKAIGIFKFEHIKCKIIKFDMNLKSIFYSVKIVLIKRIWNFDDLKIGVKQFKYCTFI